MNCYLCGSTPATHPLNLSDAFTAHSSARCLASDKLCEMCHGCIQGDEKQVWYWNENKKPKPAWSKLWGRSLSRLYQGDRLISPEIFHADSEYSPQVRNLPTRPEIRQWLINPPDPPFRIVIAESGQKHILFLSREANNRDFFPVQFELDGLWINRELFTARLQTFEQLLALGFNKTEILSGEYAPHKLMKLLAEWEILEAIIEGLRGTRFLELISYVAQKPEWVEPSQTTQETKPQKEVEQPEPLEETGRQLSLF